jgi:CopG family nickel-responsive transcriptional regulator
VERITITIDDELLATLDALCERRGYASRSEAVRDLVRAAALQDRAEGDGEAECFATLAYVYEHATRDLARRLTDRQHDRHDLSVATLHVHVSHEDCLEVVVLRGRIDDVRAMADSVLSQRGVRHGQLHILPGEGGLHAPGLPPAGV